MSDKKSAPRSQLKSAEFSVRLRLRAFVFALGMSGLLVFSYVSFSLSMTHSSWADLGLVPQAIAVLLPLFSGILAIAFPQFMKVFMDGVSRVLDVLPF